MDGRRRGFIHRIPPWATLTSAGTNRMLLRKATDRPMKEKVPIIAMPLWAEKEMAPKATSVVRVVSITALPVEATAATASPRSSRTSR